MCQKTEKKKKQKIEDATVREREILRLGSNGNGGSEGCGGLGSSSAIACCCTSSKHAAITSYSLGSPSWAHKWACPTLAFFRQILPAP